MESLIKPAAFYFFSAVAVVTAIMVIVKRNPVTSGINLVLTFCSISAIYVLLNSQFIAVIQVLVYAGAIMVLIIFVIMLLNLRPVESIMDKSTGVRIAAIFVFVTALGVSLAAILTSGGISGRSGGITDEFLAKTGTIQVISRSLFSEYLLPFELTSLLLTVAIIGVVILAKGMKVRKKTGPGSE